MNRCGKDCLFIFCFCCMFLQLKLPDSFFIYLPCLLFFPMVTCSAIGFCTLWQSDSSTTNPEPTNHNQRTFKQQQRSSRIQKQVSCQSLVPAVSLMNWDTAAAAAAGKLEQTELSAHIVCETQMEAYSSKVNVYGFFLYLFIYYYVCCRLTTFLQATFLFTRKIYIL